MAFVLVLMLMVDGKVSDVKSFPMEDRQTCEENGKQAVEYYKRYQADVKFMCVRPV